MLSSKGPLAPLPPPAAFFLEAPLYRAYSLSEASPDLEELENREELAATLAEQTSLAQRAAAAVDPTRPPISKAAPPIPGQGGCSFGSPRSFRQ